MSDRLRLAFDWVDAGTAIRTCSNAVTMRFARDPSDPCRAAECDVAAAVRPGLSRCSQNQSSSRRPMRNAS